MTFDVDIDVATYLRDNVTEKSLVLGRSIFHGPIRPVEDDCVDAMAVFVLPAGGPPPESFQSCTTSVYQLEVQITVRGDKEQYRGALALARECRDLLQSDGDPVLTGYVDLQLIESEPDYEGQDEDGSPIFSINVQATRDN